MVGPAFGAYAQFAPQPPVLQTRGHHPAFYPPPILYWGYPSPPVSPTAYYGPAGHHPQPHIAANLGPHNQPTLVRKKLLSSLFSHNYIMSVRGYVLSSFLMVNKILCNTKINI